MPRRRAKLVAWIASVGIHAALGWLLLTDDAGQLRNLPPAESMTRDELPADDFSFSMAVERTTEPAPAKPITISIPTGQRPVEPLRPSALPPEMKTLVHDLASRPVARVEVRDIAPIEFREPIRGGTGVSPILDPRTGETPVPPMEKKPDFGKGQPLHGALPSGKSVVYVLDRSTSMGLTRENFDAARAALLASVEALPAETRFQVIAYNGRAMRVLPGDLLKKADAHAEKLADALWALAPEGDSRHGDALRAALALGGDYLIFVTDAGDDELTELRPILKGHAKPVAVSVVRVGGGKVSEPTALR